MDPKSFVEHIPANWTVVDVAMYHCYDTRCNLREANFNIYVASMSRLEEKGCWEKIWDRPAGNGNNMKKDEIIREHFVTLSIPEAILMQGPYCIKVSNVANSGNWKSGW